MATPTEIQFQQLQRLISNLPLPIPAHVRRLHDGAVRVDVGNPHLIRDDDSMDSLLNDLQDIDDTIDPDDLYGELLRGSFKTV